jgi:hypothetical protein
MAIKTGLIDYAPLFRRGLLGPGLFDADNTSRSIILTSYLIFYPFFQNISIKALYLTNCI